jgi:hypothetical protein
VQDLGENGAGITSIMNIGYVSQIGVMKLTWQERTGIWAAIPLQLFEQAIQVFQAVVGFGESVRRLPSKDSALRGSADLTPCSYPNRKP